MERGAKVSGARFYFLPGVGARLELGLLNLAVPQALVNGFTPMIPPVLVRPEAMEGTGFLGEHADEVYRLEADDLYLVGTAEVPLAGYHADEILDLSAGRCATRGGRRAFGARPARTARTPAGSSGCTSSTRSRCSSAAPPRTRTRSICGCSRSRRRCSPRSRCLTASSMSRPATSAPRRRASSTARAGCRRQQAYRELTSTSNCTTFQARRLGIRDRDARRQAADRRDAQRHAGHHPVDRRHPGEPPAARRIGAGAGGAAPRPRGSRGPRARLIVTTGPTPGPWCR